MQNRYQIGNNTEGYCASTSNKNEALNSAMVRANRSGLPHWVFDRMAHVGRVEQWTVSPRDPASGVNTVTPAGPPRAERPKH